MTLLEIETEDELNFLNEFFTKNHSDYFNDWITIGGIKEGSDEWYWPSGKSISYKIPWQPGQPNGGEDCLVITTMSGALRFGDGPCHSVPWVCKFVCEKSVQIATP